METINLAKILKNCPKGTKLYSPICGECTLERVHNESKRIIILTSDYTTLTFHNNGKYYPMDNAECLLFPSKENRDWSKFQLPFKDGDIVTCTNTACTYTAIFKEMIGKDAFCHYGVLVDNKFRCRGHDWSDFNETCRFATEEEKAKLFQAIKENGYHWNVETKTLEKLIKPWTIQDAKNGDILAFNDETIIIFKDLYNKTSFHSYCHIEEGIFTISKEDMPDWWEGKGFYPATEEQRTFLFRKIKESGYKWNVETKTLEKLPKFKVGDRIQWHNTECNSHINIVKKIECEHYILDDNSYINFGDEGYYKVLKFDITTLKPFESVLVRNSYKGRWRGQFYQIYDENEEYPFECTYDCWKQCIPYTGNEHLLGTTNECDDYYKTW